ncbi:sulfurtransferase [Brachybacterium vulturis]|uniref:Sulfurtransferase n=1 Tax=Brachybacterium vulturis TaxID=2017484 RepID=A0A291GS73_9MICO|nr:sulfurtransferase [Brachybacterium vulturis]ATG52892.1 sulfurtransferase [Brachybacterium vulturis]
MTATDRPSPAPLPPLLDVAALHALLEGADGTRPVQLLDVRWALDGSKGHGTYLAGHLPGAVYIDLDTELAAPARPEAGRHPLPEPEAFAITLRRAGIAEDSLVVAYDDSNGAPAGRLVWMLRALGHDAAVLSGGLAAWDGELETTDVRPRPGDVTARAWPASRIATADEVAAGGALVVDARAPERYRGEVEPIDPRAGHVPGAVNLPFAGNLDEDGRFLAPEELRRRFTAAGAREDRETIVYCGSGVTATHDLLALESAGFTRIRLFPGSWSQWSAEAARPVAVGPNP